MERSTIFNGKIHYFDWAIFNSYVTNYQRVVVGVNYRHLQSQLTMAALSDSNSRYDQCCSFVDTVSQFWPMAIQEMDILIDPSMARTLWPGSGAGLFKWVVDIARWIWWQRSFSGWRWSWSEAHRSWFQQSLTLDEVFVVRIVSNWGWASQFWSGGFGCLIFVIHKMIAEFWAQFQRPNKHDELLCLSPLPGKAECEGSWGPTLNIWLPLSDYPYL